MDRRYYSGKKPTTWGIIWNQQTKQLIHTFEENEAFYKIQTELNGSLSIKKITNWRGNRCMELSSDIPSFYLRRELVENFYKVSFITRKQADPKLKEHCKLHPGTIILDKTSNKFCFEDYTLQIIVFDNSISLPLYVGEKMLAIENIGRGSFGKVYSAYSVDRKKLIAVKTIEFCSGINKWYGREIALKNEKTYLMSIKHPNIVHVFKEESNISDFSLCLELADKGNANQFARMNIITPDLLNTMFKHVLTGVIYLHNSELLHRDIKPSNILVFYDGKDYSFKLSDFGSVCMVSNDPYILKAHGTLPYQPPEVVRSIMWKLPISYKKSTDVFAVGATFYFILYKVHPFEALYRSEDFKEKLKNRSWTQNDLQSRLQKIKNPLLRNLITSSWNIEEKKRPTANQLLNHIFLKDGNQ